MNCIFTCVFVHEDYVKLFYYLSESILISSKCNFKFLVYTSTKFKKLIENFSFYDSNIFQFIVNDNYKNVDQACKARIDLFVYDEVNIYDKILYLDCDVVVRDDINKVFDLCVEEKIYAIKEGNITDSNNYYGKILFGKEAENYEDKEAFSSGVLLFKNCQKVKDLFSEIKKDMKTREQLSLFHDQPFVIYNCFKFDMYDNKVLNDVVVCNNTDIHKIIHHFPGGPGYTSNKLKMAENFSKEIYENKIQKIITKTKEFITNNLIPIINNLNVLVECNIFMRHHTNIISDVFENKVKNLCRVLLNKNKAQNVMEIGFNSGFSALLMLMTNENITLKCYDLGEHAYTRPCFEKIEEAFPGRISILYGNSIETVVNETEKFDIIHIDGGHSVDVARSDIKNSYKLVNDNAILIFDDYDFPNLKKLWDEYVIEYNLRQLDFNIYPSPHHDIKLVNTNKYI
tara:strand:+ start:20 stop:1387 length:1368 start_codon:yes stop_codon:yes gene_type:complete